MIVSTFVYLAILLAICLAIFAVDVTYKAIQRRRERWALLNRDVKVKDALIRELTLENRMLQVQLNMVQLVLARKQKRGLYLATDQAG
ncbi:MAG: hypothetical protein RB191_19810 [Terriglobia bacterium]|nr:hypothetical protein [Terriglobia bacterium]